MGMAMSTCPSAAPGIPRKPPAAEQYNWVTGAYEVEAEQQELPFELTPSEDGWKADEAGEGIQLLATENGAQLLVSGFGLSLGKKSERISIKLKGKVCGELPLFRVQEVVFQSPSTRGRRLPL